jgi:hypothetical protein
MPNEGRGGNMAELFKLLAAIINLIKTILD